MAIYLGKYRGVVTSIDDPKKMGRIKARVPAVTEDYETPWCLPCLPFIGNFKFNPSIGDCVWVEFERGKIDYPIWCGMWLPEGKDKLDNLVITTKDGSISFKDGEVSLTNNSGKSLNVSDIFKNFDDMAKDIDSKIEELKTWCNGRFELK